MAVNRYSYVDANPTRFFDPTGNSKRDSLGYLLERQADLVAASVEAPGSPDIISELSYVNSAINHHLHFQKSLEQRYPPREERLARNLRLGAVEGPSMSAGHDRDMIDRAPDPRELQRAEHEQLTGLFFGPFYNNAFQWVTPHLESLGIMEPMSETELRWRAYHAGEAANIGASALAPAKSAGAATKNPDRPREGKAVSSGKTSEKPDDPDYVTMFRVEGRRNMRIGAGPHGALRVVGFGKGGSENNVLFIGFSFKRAMQFLGLSLARGHRSTVIKSVQVPRAVSRALESILPFMRLK